MTIFSSGFRRVGARLTAFVALTAVLSAGLVGVSSATAAPRGVQIDTAPVVVQVQELTRAAVALSGSNFDPGYIISDWSFYNANGMTQAQIQAFLDAKCPTNNCIDTKKMSTTARAATNMCPTAYAAASNETFAAIIYKVQRSCGISAKVILVTLQKEQGLLNLQNPTDLKLRKAMGMGCPDTSVCDSKYYGFFNQVYYGASQLKRYGLRTSDNISFRTKYQIGVPYPIAYKTIASCGTRTVTVKTKATTALYYYTPYTPNAKALANLSGTGDSCSSYGNRNFWVYYNSWFGSSLAGRGNDAITAAYEKLGGAAGVLGAAGVAPNCATSTTCSQSFAHGVVYWTLAGGALAVTGAVGDYYLAKGGVTGTLGVPTSAPVPVTANGGGTAQAFSKALVNSSAAGIFTVSGTMRTRHGQLGGVGGAIGWPTGELACGLAGGGCSQEFQNAIMYAPAKGTVQAIDRGPVLDLFQANAGPAGALGYPTSASIPVAANGGGIAQAFTNGLVNSGPSGAFIMSGAVRTRHGQLGGVAGQLGWPVEAQQCGLAGGGCSQAFQNGVLYAPKTGTAQAITSAPIQALYTSLSGPSGSLGYPTSATVAVAANGGGHAQAFANALINAGPAGAFVMKGVIRTKHSAAGGVGGSYGWPTGAEVCGLAGGGCSQSFQGGTIYTLK